MDQYVTLVAILDRLIMVVWQILLYKTKMQSQYLGPTSAGIGLKSTAR